MYREKKKCIDGLGNYNDFLVVSVMSDSTRDSGSSYLYGGYNYNITTQADWYDPNLNYYGDYYVRNSNYYTGYVHTPLPGGFIPRSYRYNWSGNTCTMDLYDDYRQTGNSCQRRFQYRNNQFYWLR
jgi:hypothetical protein